MQDAILSKNVKVTKLLLKRGADPNFNPDGMNHPLQFAVRRGYLEIVELLISHNVDLNHKFSGHTALHYFVVATLHSRISLSQRNVEMLKVMVCSGASVNIQNKNGNNVIESCLEMKHIRLAKVIWFN